MVRLYQLSSNLIRDKNEIYFGVFEAFIIVLRNEKWTFSRGILENVEKNNKIALYTKLYINVVLNPCFLQAFIAAKGIPLIAWTDCYLNGLNVGLSGTYTLYF